MAVKEAVIKAKEASARAEAAIGQHETPAPPLVRVKLIPETASTPFEPPMPEEKLESPFEPAQPSPALDSPQPWAQPGVQAARELALKMQQETEAAVREAVARAAVEWAASGEATAVKEAMAKAKACTEQGLLPQQHATPHFQASAPKSPPQKLTVQEPAAAQPQPAIPPPPNTPPPKFLWSESGTKHAVEWNNEMKHTACGQELWGVVMTESPYALSRRAWFN